MLFFVNADGGLTQVGYAATIAVGVVCFFVAMALASRHNKKKQVNVKQLAFCAMGIALAFVTSYIKLWELPWGGSVTLCSMLFIVLLANWYGIGTGVFVGLSYGILQFIQEPYVLSFFQVCCDYILAFAALGLAGFFAENSGVFRGGKHGLLIGYILAVIARGAFHSLGGYLYWMDYMPENFPKALAAIYPIVYNYSYLFAEAVLTIIVISIPAVKKALVRVRQMARE